MENCANMKSSLIDAFLAISASLFDFRFEGFPDAERAKVSYLPILLNKIMKVLERINEDRLNSSLVHTFVRDSEIEANIRERIARLVKNHSQEN